MLEPVTVTFLKYAKDQAMGTKQSARFEQALHSPKTNNFCNYAHKSSQSSALIPAGLCCNMIAGT